MVTDTKKDIQKYMTRFAKIYQEHKKKKEELRKLPKQNSFNREGYGYIKRRVGILPSELETPSYTSISELSDLISKNSSKS